MATDKLPLTIALSNYPHLLEIKNGTVPIANVAGTFPDYRNMVVAFRQMVRDVAFDVSEMAPTTYLIARATGAPYVALPVFVMRHFHHSGIVCRPEAGIKGPKDLEGRRVGVRAYSVTSAVWTRAVLASEYGVDCAKVTWVVADEEHVTAIRLPGNVVRAPAGRSLADMMAAGELDASFSGAPGMGPAGPEYRELLPDAAGLEADWFRRTGIYPLHGLVVVKDDLLAKHPCLGGALFRAFVEAKDRYLPRLKSGQANTPADQRYRALADLVGDPLPYGLAANRRSIDALIATTVEQGLLAEAPPLDRLFIAPEG